jgi:hypothetical protein
MRALDLKMLIYFMAIWNILRTYGIFYDHLVHLCSFGIFSGFGITYQEKSGNPDIDPTIQTLVTEVHKVFLCNLETPGALSF